MPKRKAPIDKRIENLNRSLRSRSKQTAKQGDRLNERERKLLQHVSKLLKKIERRRKEKQRLYEKEYKRQHGKCDRT